MSQLKDGKIFLTACCHACNPSSHLSRFRSSDEPPEFAPKMLSKPSFKLITNYEVHHSVFFKTCGTYKTYLPPQFLFNCHQTCKRASSDHPPQNLFLGFLIYQKLSLQCIKMFDCKQYCKHILSNSC